MCQTIYNTIIIHCYVKTTNHSNYFYCTSNHCDDIIRFSTGFSTSIKHTTTNTTSVSAITISGKGTGGIAYDPIHETMYVTILSDNSTSVIDTNTLKPLPINISEVGYSPANIAYDPSHKTMYVSSASGNNISVINTTTNSIIGNPISLPPSRPTTLSGNVTLFNGLFGMTYDPIHKTMYVANIEPNTVSVINTTTNSIIGNPIPAGKQPQLAAYDPVHKTHVHDKHWSDWLYIG